MTAPALRREGSDIVRLEAAGLRALHVLPHAGDTAGVHHIVSQSPLFEQVLKMRTINRFGDGLFQFCPYVGPVAITDRLN